MPNIKLQSEFLFESMKGEFSKEECEKASKEILFNELRSYLKFFEGHIYHKIKDISEGELTEMVFATKFFCRIEDARQGFLNRTKEFSDKIENDFDMYKTFLKDNNA